MGFGRKGAGAAILVGVLAAGCSSSRATGSADAGAFHDGPLIDLPVSPVDAPTDAAVEAAPLFVEHTDGTPCPAGVACRSGLCGGGGLCLPRYDWSRLLPDDGCARWLAAAPDGDLVVLGASSTTANGLPWFVAKYDAELNLRWRRSFAITPTPSPIVPAPAVLADGTIVVALDGTGIELDSGVVAASSTSDSRGIVFAVSSTGSYRWAKMFPRPFSFQDQIVMAAVTPTPSGGIAIGGSFKGQVNFDFDGVAPVVGIVEDITTIAFVAEYDANAKLSWVKTYPHSSVSSLGEFSGLNGFLGVAPGGGIFVAGAFAGNGVFGNNNETLLTFGTRFVAHLDSSGSLTAPGSWVTYPTDVAHWALAPDGAFFQVQNGTDFARIDPTTGRPLWSYPATSLRIFRAIAGANAVLLSGEFDAPTDFDFGPNQVVYQPRGPASSPSTAFLASYDANGALQWVREPTVFTTAEAIGRDGAIYGLTSYVPPELIDFDPGPAVDAILPVLGKGCYIVKYGP